MLAVLPFENLGAPEDEYFADGMTEEIISRLSAIQSIGVISRTSVYKYKSEQKTIPEIAEELGVQYILEISKPGYVEGFNQFHRFFSGHN